MFRLFPPILVQRPREDRCLVRARRSSGRAHILIPALVTGGGTGLGKTIASALVQNGAKVYIAARKEAQLKEVCPRRTFAREAPHSRMSLLDGR